MVLGKHTQMSINNMDGYLRPLISICIPTYNRGDVLRKSLDSYIDCDGFDEEVEIVISDNASTDNTQEVGEWYSSKYDNIKYFRNDNNIRDRNFPLSLERATGEYLKLMKDNLILSKQGINYLKEAIRKNIDRRTTIFFTNGFLFNSSRNDAFFCKDINDFIIHTSYRITAITFFGCWREQWPLVTEREKYSKLQLAQDDWIYQLLIQKSESLLYTKKFFSAIEVGKRSGYNWFEVHVDNYYQILQSYFEQGMVSSEALKKEKKTYLKGLKPQLVYKYLWKIYPDWEFDMAGATGILKKHFSSLPYFYWLMITLPFWGVIEGMKYKIMALLIKLGLKDTINSIRVDRKL